MNADKERYYQTQLLVERARYYQLLDEAYPDVGMGKTLLMCLEEAQKDFGYTHIDIKKVSEHCNDSL
jgi:hypothetical protein